MITIKRTIIFLCFLLCKPSFTMHHTGIRYGLYSAFISSGTYVACKLISKYEENIYDDVPKNVEELARKKLTTTGLSFFNNGDWIDKSVKLKVNHDTFMPGSFIAVDDTYCKRLNSCIATQSINEEHKKEVFMIKSLLSRAYSYHNNDHEKFCLLYGMTMGIPFLYPLNIPFCVSTLVVGMGINLMYLRNQKTRADEFAYINMPVDDLKIIKAEEIRLKSLDSDQTQQKKYFINLAEFVANPKKLNHEQQILLIEQCLQQKNQELCKS